MSDLSARSEPRYSIVTAVYDVARYLPEFIASIEAQTIGTDRLQVVAVDDGSTDDSLAVLQAWQERRPELVTVLTKVNGGQASARNLGLGTADGDWVTFTDPDDTLAPDYFSRVDDFVRAHPETEMVATKFVYDEEATGTRRDGHPLKWRFAGGDQLVDLDRFPRFFHGSAPAAFFRSDRVAALGLQFDERLRPHFEDGHFCVRYLIAAEAPLVGFVGSAIYYYRRRADQSSTLQGSIAHPGRYAIVPELGYLDCLRRSAEQTGDRPAEWIQNLIIYELSWYFSAETAVSGNQTAAVGEVAATFRRVLAEIATLLDPEVVEGFTIRRFDRRWRDILQHGLQDRPWHTPYVVMQQYDARTGQVRVSYRYTGTPPAVRYLIRGQQVEPLHHKVQGHRYFDAVLLREHAAWLPTGTLRVEIDGRPVDLRSSWLAPTTISRTPAQIKREFVRPASAQPTLVQRLRRLRRSRRRPRRGLSRKARLLQRLARTAPARLVFGRAWVLIDRVHDADDNAERLFRHLRLRHPRINAWFVVERDTPDWHRLRADGLGRRVVAYGSIPWRFLMLNCRHLLSSHIDDPVYRPPQITYLRTPDWTFSFLQHGVIKDDLSNWLNTKKVDLFVTSTPAEHASIVGDDTGYKFTDKEVRLTGLPRFDRLREVGRSQRRRDHVLLAPTWRHWLSTRHAATSQRRDVIDTYLESDFHLRWMEVLASDRLAELAARHGLKVAFLPHPNLQAALEQVALPDHVERLHFHGADVQDHFARSAVLVTDYSSMAFNAAYIDRPVVYYQFDADRMLGGGHVGRAGYFDYRRDGFGPVVDHADQVVESVAEILDHGSMLPTYAERVAATFPQRDGECCERVTQAVRALDRRTTR